MCAPPHHGRFVGNPKVEPVTRAFIQMRRQWRTGAQDAIDGKRTCQGRSVNAMGQGGSMFVGQISSLRVSRQLDIAKRKLPVERHPGATRTQSPS